MAWNITYFILGAVAVALIIAGRVIGSGMEDDATEAKEEVLTSGFDGYGREMIETVLRKFKKLRGTTIFNMKPYGTDIMDFQCVYDPGDDSIMLGAVIADDQSVFTVTQVAKALGVAYLSKSGHTGFFAMRKFAIIPTILAVLMPLMCALGAYLKNPYMLGICSVLYITSAALLMVAAGEEMRAGTIGLDMLQKCGIVSEDQYYHVQAQLERTDKAFYVYKAFFIFDLAFGILETLQRHGLLGGRRGGPPQDREDDKSSQRKGRGGRGRG